MADAKPLSTPMSMATALNADENGEAVDQKEYWSMISSLLYLMATRPDIHFAVCLCACFQASPRASHRQAVKRIMRYLRFTPELGLWYSASSVLSLRGYSDADFAGCRLDRKSWVHVSFWVLRLCHGLLANCLVLLNPLQKPSTLLLQATAPSFCGCHPL